jgi:curved DNA-binding protein CbpA
MGNTSSQNINPAHIRIYVNILSIKNVQTRAQMIQTVLAGSEYVITAKQLGVYSHMLNYVVTVQNGMTPPSLPYEKPSVHNASQYQERRTAEQIRQEYKTQNRVESLVIPPPTKRDALNPSDLSLQTSSARRDFLSKPKNDEKAIGYFQACLEVLGLEEEVALTHETLKSAYKKAALRNHPDKGGSEKGFEKVTRAYAYLTEILRRIHGGRKAEGKVEEPNVLKDSRKTESKEWQHVEPVKLNPKKLDLDAFNKMFEQTRIPDPEEDGYGDWLKNEKESSSTSTFSGKFNRDVFNQMFDDEAKKNAHSGNFIIHQPEALLMAPTMGIELGRGKPDSYTAPSTGKNMYFTDLKQAYTLENNISQQVASVRVDQRNYESYKNDYNKAPKPLEHTEMEQISNAEKIYAKREEERRRRAAEEEVNASSYFERMKRLVLTDSSKEK